MHMHWAFLCFRITDPIRIYPRSSVSLKILTAALVPSLQRTVPALPASSAASHPDQALPAHKNPFHLEGDRLQCASVPLFVACCTFQGLYLVPVHQLEKESPSNQEHQNQTLSISYPAKSSILRKFLMVSCHKDTVICPRRQFNFPHAFPFS
jgi:hypothetical protein